MNVLADTLKRGGIGVIPTDTIYGVVARALDVEAVAKLYDLKGRQPDKPLIILISDISQIEAFSIPVNDRIKRMLEQYWPGPVSVILPCESDSFAYLHRGKHSLAFRLPAHEKLRGLINLSGPLVAPSANPEGRPPATTIEEARRYFQDRVDFYLDGGTLAGKPSRLIRVSPGGDVEILRP